MDAKDKILKIESELGLSASGMAKAMKVSTKTYYNKKNDKIPDHSFNEKNYQDLVLYLKNYFPKAEEEIDLDFLPMFLNQFQTEITDEWSVVSFLEYLRKNDFKILK